MTPKEKAAQLLETMSDQTYSYQPYAGAHYCEDTVGYEAGKKCAMTAVKQIIDLLKVASELNMVYRSELMVYYQEVEREINNI